VPKKKGTNTSLILEDKESSHVSKLEKLSTIIRKKSDQTFTDVEIKEQVDGIRELL